MKQKKRKGTLQIQVKETNDLKLSLETSQEITDNKFKEINQKNDK